MVQILDTTSVLILMIRHHFFSNFLYQWSAPGV